MSTHSSVLAWEIPWTEEPGQQQSMGVTKESDTTQGLNNKKQICHRERHRLAIIILLTIFPFASKNSLESLLLPSVSVIKHMAWNQTCWTKKETFKPKLNIIDSSVFSFSSFIKKLDKVSHEVVSHAPVFLSIPWDSTKWSHYFSLG